MTTGVIIMRAQVHKLHDGHKHLIEEVQKVSDEVVILLGVSDKYSGRNPLTYALRVRMIKEFTDLDTDHPTIFIPLYDSPGDHEDWSNRVDLVLEAFKNPTLYHSRDSFKEHYVGKYPTVEIPELPGFSGTKVRNELGIRYTEDFRAGIIYALTRLNQR